MRAERSINELGDALADENYDAACDVLAPEGTADIVTGGKGGEVPRSRCPEVLELATRVSGVDWTEVPTVEINETRGAGDELVAEADNGEVWRLTPDPDYTITAVPR